MLPICDSFLRKWDLLPLVEVSDPSGVRIGIGGEAGEMTMHRTLRQAFAQITTLEKCLKELK
jgi:hypothetical protein